VMASLPGLTHLVLRSPADRPRMGPYELLLLTAPPGAGCPATCRQSAGTGHSRVLRYKPDHGTGLSLRVKGVQRASQPRLFKQTQDTRSSPPHFWHTEGLGAAYKDRAHTHKIVDSRS
jgi:hypothetical protein